jgi:HSP20 family molecular chaperone IbpA
MASSHWDFVLWQRTNLLLEQAERIQRNFLQVVHYISGPGRAGRWVPPVNLVETEEACWVISALPGVRIDDLVVRLEGEELIIRGKSVLPECCTEGELSLWEIPLGDFERRLRLIPGRPLAIGASKLESGLLVIELKKI